MGEEESWSASAGLNSKTFSLTWVPARPQTTHWIASTTTAIMSRRTAAGLPRKCKLITVAWQSRNSIVFADMPFMARTCTSPLKAIASAESVAERIAGSGFEPTQPERRSREHRRSEAKIARMVSSQMRNDYRVTHRRLNGDYQKRIAGRFASQLLYGTRRRASDG